MFMLNLKYFLLNTFLKKIHFEGRCQGGFPSVPSRYFSIPLHLLRIFQYSPPPPPPKICFPSKKHCMRFATYTVFWMGSFNVFVFVSYKLARSAQLYKQVGHRHARKGRTEQNTKLSITHSFLELQSPDFAWKLVWTHFQTPITQ